jgi:hypothetical protein
VGLPDGSIRQRSHTLRLVASISQQNEAIMVTPTRDSDLQQPGRLRPTAKTRIGLIVAISVAAGLIAAVALVAAPFVPADGNALTGVVLLGFALGWASLDAKAYHMPGQLIDVGGHRLHLHCTGSGSPTVVLEPGGGAASCDLGWIAPGIARSTRVCVDDRAGRGWSDAADVPQDGAHLAADLHTLLGPRPRSRPVRAGRSLVRRPVHSASPRVPG